MEFFLRLISVVALYYFGICAGNVVEPQHSTTKPGGGLWLDRIFDVFGSKNFHSFYNKLFNRVDNGHETKEESLSDGSYEKRFETPKPYRGFHGKYRIRPRMRYIDNRRIWNEKKWVNVKIVNQMGGRIRVKPDKILPSTVLDGGEIFVYHRLLKAKDRKKTIVFRAFEADSDKPLLLNDDFRFLAKASSYDETQETYITRPGKLGNKWMYVKLINEAGGKVKVTPNKILTAMTLNGDETQIAYSRLEPGDEKKKIILTAKNVRTKEPLKLNREYTLALRPDDAGNVATIKITRGDTITARCYGFKPYTDWRGNSFEYQFVVDQEKNWFDALRSCQVCDADLLSVQSREENEFITKELRKTSEVNKLWMGMTFYIKTRMWIWSDGREYRYSHWKEGIHYDGPDEQCGVIYQQYDWGRWDDDNCYKTQGFICKRTRKRHKNGESTKEKEEEDRGPFQDCKSPVECPPGCKMSILAHHCQKCDCGPLVKLYNFANGTGHVSLYNSQVLHIKNNFRDLQNGFRTHTTSQSEASKILHSNPQRSVMGFEPIKSVLEQRNAIRGSRQGKTQGESQFTKDLPPRALVNKIMGLIESFQKPANNTLIETKERVKRT